MLKLIEWRIIEANRLSYDFWNSRARNGEYFDWNQFKWLTNPTQVTKQYKYTGDYIERGKRGNQKFRATINPDDEVWFRYINKDIYERRAGSDGKFRYRNIAKPLQARGVSLVNANKATAKKVTIGGCPLFEFNTFEQWWDYEVALHFYELCKHSTTKTRGIFNYLRKHRDSQERQNISYQSKMLFWKWKTAQRKRAELYFDESKKKTVFNEAWKKDPIFVVLKAENRRLQRTNETFDQQLSSVIRTILTEMKETDDEAKKRRLKLEEDAIIREINRRS